MASLKYTNLTGFFREDDELKKNKVVRPALPGMNNYYKAMIITAVQYQHKMCKQSDGTEYREYRYKPSYIYKHVSGNIK